MKKVAVCILFSCISLLIGCGDYEDDIPDLEGVDTRIIESKDENTKINSNKEIIDMYSNLKYDKGNLRYNILDKVNYYYETEKEMVGMRGLDQIPKINDKTYGEILKAYTFESLSTGVSMEYDKALEYVTKVLPDDIKMERETFNPESGAIYIFYSSSKGNFVTHLVSENYIYKDGKQVYDKSTISGISYMKEIVE